MAVIFFFDQPLHELYLFYSGRNNFTKNFPLRRKGLIRVRVSTVKLSNFNKFSNRTELSRTNSILSRRTVPELFDYFCIFFKKFGSVRSNRIDQLNIIQYLHHLNASYSVNFEVRFDRTEPNFLKKKHKNNKKVRVRFAVTNSYLIRFGSANA